MKVIIKAKNTKEIACSCLVNAVKCIDPRFP